jgi:hypothetical protein
MKFRRFITRRMRGARFFPMRVKRGLVGARENILLDFFERPIPPYRGTFDEHVFMLVKAGTVAFKREGSQVAAREGDALLIGRGDKGRLSFTRCPVKNGLVVEIMTFDERAIVDALRRHSRWESEALLKQCKSPGALVLPEFQKSIPENAGWRYLCTGSFYRAMDHLLSGDRQRLPGFLREGFYVPRWRLCVFLERYVLPIDGANAAGAQYAGGPDKLRRDTLFYLGAKPERILARRRAELATAWLRCGHTVDEVGKALGFAGRWQFECFYSATTHRRCHDVQQLLPLSQAEPEELLAAMRPCWWSGKRKLSIEIPYKKERPTRRVMSEAEERQFAKECRRREKLTIELRGKAADFFTMRSTGAALLLPIFQFEKPKDAAA